MTSGQIQVSVFIDDKIFRKFANFDTMRRQKRWRSPLIFALILTASAVACFLLRHRAEGAVLLGCVLLVVGLGLPLVYFLTFARSVRRNIQGMGLAQKARHAYDVTLSEAGISVSTEKESLSRGWGELLAAYRVDGCIYLYAAAQRAYLLPAGQASRDDDTLWAMLTDHLPAQRVFDLRR